MKKIITAAVLTGALTLAGIQLASAHGGRYYNKDNYGPGYCGGYYSESRTFTEEDQVALEKFRDDTSGIRKEIVVKSSELNALMLKDNPDETKVAKLTSDLYDLRTQLDEKAETAGLDSRYAGYGPGMMHGYGWGRGGHMMGW